jgi:hypothetical protein
VSEIVIVCESAPDVAVTVTVELTGGAFDDPDEPPPQPLRMSKPAALSARSNSTCSRRRFLNPNPQSATAKADSGSIGNPLGRFCAVAAEVVMVTAVEVVPGGVTLAGEKLHDAPAGRPEEHANETAEAKPPCGDSEMVAVPLPPAVTDIVAGEAAIEKSGRAMMYAALARPLLRNPLATATAWSVSVDTTLIGPTYEFEPVVGSEPSVV